MTDKPLALQPPDPRIKLRPVRRSDVPALHRRCMADERPLYAVQRLVERAQLNASQGRGLGVVALTTEGEDMQIAGFGQLTLWPRCGEISDLVVHEALRGQGIGTALIQYLCQAGRDMRLDCLEIGAEVTNTRARALYRRLGFVESHTVQLEYAEGVIDVVYLRVALK